MSETHPGVVIFTTPGWVSGVICYNFVIHGMPDGIEPDQLIHALQHLTGRVIGVNLEAVDPALQQENSEFWALREGRLATTENAHKLLTLGANSIVLTGNPGNGITNEAIHASLRAIHAAVGEKAVLIAGKMHAAGVLVTNGFSEGIPLVTRSEPDPWKSQMYTKLTNLIEVL